MRLRYKILFPVFACILTTFTLNAGGYTHAKSIYHTKKSPHRITAGSNTNYLLLINPIESIPVINIQLHKIVHCAQAMFCAVNDLTACLKCYNFFSGNGHRQFTSSQKILLFPFHAFW